MLVIVLAQRHAVGPDLDRGQEADLGIVIGIIDVGIGIDAMIGFAILVLLVPVLPVFLDHRLNLRHMAAIDRILLLACLAHSRMAPPH